MLATIARKEFTELLRDGRFRWAAAIVLALLAVAIFAGARYQRDLVAQQRAAQIEEQHRWYHQSDKNPHSAAHYGLYAFKPRLAPGFVDPGVEPYTGIGTWLEAHYQNEMVFRPAADATLAQRFGDLTVALVLQIMLPLVIVLLAFNAFAGERERGTLRQLLSLGLRPRDLVFGKILGLAGALALIVAPALVLGGVALALVDNGGSAARFAVLAAIYAVYPHGAPAKLQGKIDALMKQHGVSWPEDLPINLRGLSLQTGEEHGYEVNDRFLGQLFGQMEAQDRVGRSGAALFPLAGVQVLSMALAGTDLAQHLDFVRAAEAHRRVIQKLMNDAVMTRVLQPGEVYVVGREMWAKVPPFAYEPPSTATVLARNALPLAALAVWFAAAAWFALRSTAVLRPV